MNNKSVSLYAALSLRKRITWAIVAIVIGIVAAGFWNYKAVDGFGRIFVAGHLIGDTGSLASAFDAKGYSFGIIFAAVAGLAATFTACNCVVYAMLPSLVCATDRASSRSSALRAFGIFTLGVLVICAFYGLYVGTLDAASVKDFNSMPVRLSQAKVTYTILGLFMLIWGMAAFGFFNRILKYVPLNVRQFIASPLMKAGIMGVMVGFFTIGRPFPVFRDFLTYAAASHNPLYGAFVMCIQGIGQIAVMVVLFLVLFGLFRKRLGDWVAKKPHQSEMISNVALLIGGAYFVYYWGIAITYNLGSWGFKLGIYH